MEKFTLSENFINKYKRKKAPFGFNGLGELVYMRTYSRIKENGKNERWWETVQRVVEGTYNMQMNWIESHQLGWNPWQAQRSAQDMYDRIFNMKFLPPGRGLWAMGTAITEERGLYAALNNCAFVSTKTLKDDYAKPFCFLMDASMLGVGVGFDTKGAGEIVIKGGNVFRGYENNPEANKKSFMDDWFRTGDQGFIDEEGFLTISGRLKEIINRGGEKISPREVDEVLMDHPNVEQVVTFSIPHDKLGEEIAAAIVLNQQGTTSEEDLKTYAASKLSDFKVPRKIIFLEEIPKGATGKLQRIGLSEKLGLN